MSVVAITKDNFDKVISATDIVAIKFTAEWCGPCKSFAPIYEEVSDKYPDVTFAAVDTEAQPELAQEFAVRSVPFLLILRERVVIYSGSGTLPASALEDLIEQAKKLDMDEVRKQAQEAQD